MPKPGRRESARQFRCCTSHLNLRRAYSAMPLLLNSGRATAQCLSRYRASCEEHLEATLPLPVRLTAC